MMQRMRKRIGISVCMLFCLMLLGAAPTTVKADTVHIVLDPGHGGDNSGAQNNVHGVNEKSINLKLGLYLKEALEQYEGVTVSMTRDSDRSISLERRANQAKEENADVFISLHNNALGDIEDFHTGCTVIVPLGTYHPEVSRYSKELGANILHELEALGIENRGLMQRVTQNGDTYSNGGDSDYYGVIRRCVLNETPGMIIEHCYMDDESDYGKFLESEEKLKALAEADARGIARFYQLPLKETGAVEEPLKNEEVMMVQVVSEYARDNIVWYETYFECEEPESEVAAEASTEIESEAPADTELNLTLESETEELAPAATESEIADSTEINEAEAASGFGIKDLLLAFVAGLALGVIVGILVKTILSKRA